MKILVSISSFLEDGDFTTPDLISHNMKYSGLLFLLSVMAITIPATAQTNEHLQIVVNSIPNKDAKFLMFPTRNIYNFLKLNTRNGEVYMVQFSLDTPNNRAETKIESYEYPLVNKYEESNGRFYLYPTQNMFNFILMDQIDGRVWQLQWGFEKKDRGLVRITNLQTYINQTDTTMISELEFKENLYYKKGELFTGEAYSSDKQMKSFFYEGRYRFTRAFHFNLTQDAFTFKQESDIPDSCSWFADDYGNDITKEAFIEKYPAVIRKAKEFAKTIK